ncbi:NmrA family NAD(P)-binding protein [Devosia oryziradicis]|uniref:NmrA family NAD(P)-binding protein n=1 Tax=Devosia oryziradicis TaxID=2801335 RepID=A0ABX7BTH5_9HYPH|nr:NAD(P)H-binding protein [Devosia oryziradicis]QQR35223.1 NmrA family NAD(P)-binding protein [Devosia oryziradicis]
MAQFGDQTLLVTGAAGQFGRIAVEELLARGATRVIAGTRDPDKLAELAARGVTVRKVDFDDAASLASGFAGVDRVLIISTDGIGKRVAQQTAAVAAAKAAGVKHIVYTSAPAARPNADAGLAAEHFWTEVAIAQSGIDFTILRDHMYAENNLMSAANEVASGQIFGLIGDRGTAYVSRADAARTAAGALLTAEGKTVLDVTGPAPVTNAERAALYSELTGKTITSIAITPPELTAGMVAAGLPEGFAQALVAFQVDAVIGYHGAVTDVVEHFSGRKPTSFADFLAENRAALGA